MGVATYGEHLYAHAFELFVFLGEVYQFRGANEREVGRIEEEYSHLPFTSSLLTVLNVPFWKA